MVELVIVLGRKWQLIGIFGRIKIGHIAAALLVLMIISMTWI